MISAIFIAFSGLLSAFRDTLTDHFGISIFSNWDKIRFDHTKGSLGRKIGGYYFDGWHIAKSLELLCFISAATFYAPITPYKLVDILILGSIYILVFDLFYGLLFKRR